MRGLGQRAGPLPGCCMLATGCAFSRHGHELTIMEFVKPKPGSVENLFLISGRHLGATAKCVRAGEQRLHTRLGSTALSTQPAWPRG